LLSILVFLLLSLSSLFASSGRSDVNVNVVVVNSVVVVAVVVNVAFLNVVTTASVVIRIGNSFDGVDDIATCFGDVGDGGSDGGDIDGLKACRAMLEVLTFWFLVFLFHSENL